MRIAVIALVLCACQCLTSADVGHLKAAKARLAARLASKHHKRGVLSAVPPFKLGHDIPHVTHSVVKPLVVSYPPTASVTAVKVPLHNPLIHRYPVPTGHKIPSPHPHFGLKFPHHTKTLVVPKPDHHYHHHHHHLEPKPIVPVVPANPVPVVPVAQPTGVIATPIPAPPPAAVHPAPVLPAHHGAVFQHPIPIGPPNHFNIKPILPAATFPLQPAAVPLAQAPIAPPPVFPLAPQYPYVIRPGNAVQTSYFATYPRYPLVNYQSPLIPLAAPLAPPAVGQVLLGRPEAPSFHLIPQAVAPDGVVEQPSPALHLEPTPTLIHPTQSIPHHVHLQPTPHAVHLQPTPPAVQLQPTLPTVHLQPTQPAVSIDHNGWSPVSSQPHDIAPTQHPEAHFPQAPETQFVQQQGTQVYEHHTGDEQQYHDYQQHLQHHIQQQIEQAQYEQHLNNQHQLSSEYGVPQNLNQEYGSPNPEYQQGHDYAHQAQEYAHQNQEYSQQAQEYAHQNQEYSQHGQEYAQHAQEYAQQEQDYSLQQQQEYGLPQAEGRSAEGEGETQTQRYHNHIPLGLQPPLDRPLENFR